MLTRIEIDGFKSFEQFSLDVGPFLVIVGPNGSGKSNLFDAIQLLSRLASNDLRTAVSHLRGEPHELFRTAGRGPEADRIRLAVEVLLDPRVRDPWGTDVQLSHTRVRYEVEIERRNDERGIERLFIVQEAARPILSKKDAWRPAVCSSEGFRRAFMRYSRKSDLLSSTGEGDSRTFEIHQDGKQGRKRPAQAAEATVLSSITSTEFPHLFALREEMRSWRFLHLDPAGLREPSPTVAPDILEPNGSNLATVLARLWMETRSEDQPKGVLAEIVAALSSMVPGVLDVSVHEERENRRYQVDLSMRDERPFSSRVVSDGTLRLLALLTLLHDPRHRGLVCFEEPENGVHPDRLKTLIPLLRSLVTDLEADAEDSDQPLSQMLLNSHSPVVLSNLVDGEMMFADLVSVIDPETKSIRRRTRMRPVKPRDQGELELNGEREYISRFEVNRYLSTASTEA